MKKSRNALLLAAGTILLSMVFVGCAQQVENKDDKEQLWDYRPMISKESRIYGDTGYTKESLSEDWVLLGRVEEQVSQTEPMVKGATYFISNTLPVNTEIYGDEQDGEIIYAKYNDKFIKYELIEE